jgi:cystathionine beta-lyase family protein involved in aluminum resistance
MKNSNNSNEEMYLSMGISKTVYDYGCVIEKSLRERFDEVDRNAEYNQLKVVKAMQQHQVSEACLLGTTGYGYNDLGRDTLEAVYAATFHTEDALVRPQITCGTHALALALMSNLRPGDELLSPVGKPYDTLEEIEAEQDNELYEKLLSAIDDDFNKVNTQAASKKKDEHRIVINKLVSTDDILNDL